MRAVGTLVIVVAGLAAACSGSGSATPAPVALEPAVECLGVPERTCQEIVTEARRNAPSGAFPVTIKATCTVAPCTIQNGEVETEVVYSNGDTQSSAMGWAGAEEPAVPAPGEPAVPGDPVCLGMPLQTCRDLASSASKNATEGREIASITVRCRAVPCSTAAGSGDTVVQFADGTSLVTEWTYENAIPSD